MRVSIITPAYNAEPYLAQTLDSVIEQSVPDWEMIVVDDGSTDATASIAQEYAKDDSRFRVIRQENAGTAAARNAGAGAIAPEADCVLFLDHDDLLAADALARLLSALELSPESVGAHGLALKIDAQGDPLGEGEDGIQNYDRRKLVSGRIERASRTEPTTAAMIVFDNLICTPGQALIRRSALERLREAGPLLFNPSFAPLDDWDFWLRLARLGDLAFLDRVVLSWRRHPAAGSQNTAAMSAGEMRIREHLASQDLPDDLARVASFCYHKLLATSRRRAAREYGSVARRRLQEGRLLAGVGLGARSLREYAGYCRLLCRRS